MTILQESANENQREMNVRLPTLETNLKSFQCEHALIPCTITFLFQCESNATDYGLQEKDNVEEA